MISFRLMKPGDIPAGLSLCRTAGWNHVQRDWEIFLQLGPEGCLVAETSGKVVGTVATIRYPGAFSWISMVLVDPAHYRKGIGTRLLTEALDILRAEETVKLDATPAGREMYLKLNFLDEYRLSRLVAAAAPSITADSSVRKMQKNDLPAVVKFDREIFGADRAALLGWIWEGAPQYAFLLEKEKKLQGYCFGRNGHNFAYIGPVIATDLAYSRELATAALANCQGRPVIIDVMHHEPQWVDWLISLGFTEQRSLIRMYRGTNRFQGRPDKQYAIAGPEFG